MSRKNKPNERAPTHDFGAVLRRPDGSFDIAAYAKAAHRERALASVSLVNEAIRMVRELASAIRTRLAPVGSSELASGKHHVPT
jgi:hypothetical protein